MKLTIHQKKTIAAMWLISIQIKAKYRAEMIEGRMYALRYDIGSVVYGHAQGLGLPTMKALEREGLVLPESKENVSAVERGICRCGCDRWALTDDGVRLAKSMNINFEPSPLTFGGELY